MTARVVHKEEWTGVCIVCSKTFAQSPKGRRRLFCVTIGGGGRLPACAPTTPPVVEVRSTWWVNDFHIRRVA